MTFPLPPRSHPNHLTDNKDCVLCMSCVKACPNLSVEVHIRPLGEDLWNGHVGSAAEVALLFLLLGAPLAHHVRFLSPGTAEAFASPTMAGIALTLGAMCVPAAVLFGAEWGSRVFLMPAAGELAERVFGKDTLQAIAGATGTSLPLRRGDGAGVATGGSEAGRVAGTGTGGGRDRIPELAAAWRSLTNGKGPQLAAQGAGVAGGAAEVSIDGGEQDWLASVQKAMPRWFESGSGSQGLPETSIPPLLKFGATTEPWWPAYIYLPMVW